jgi:hypothetical protein
MKLMLSGPWPRKEREICPEQGENELGQRSEEDNSQSKAE